MKLFTENIWMYFLLFSSLAYLSACHSFVKQDASNDCSFLLEHLNSRPDVSLEIKKTGFHRELVTSVRFNTSGLHDKVLLVYNWPKDIFVDPYQLASLGDQRNWEILLDSAIDLEMPVHKSSGFVAYLYPHLEESTPGLFNITIPIHGRYQKPSFNGNAFSSVDIYPPDLLLHVEKCQSTQLNNMEAYTVVDAPCTAEKSSSCQWVKVHHQQHPGHVTLQIPVGDGSLVIPVCGGTLLITMICCVGLSKYAWTHRIM